MFGWGIVGLDHAGRFLRTVAFDATHDNNPNAHDLVGVREHSHSRRVFRPIVTDGKAFVEQNG